jgi:ParB family transcriptional regulator, chromosome partitioning protein
MITAAERKKSKPTNRVAEHVSAETIEEIPLSLVDRHPSNRIIHPDDVVELAKSIQEHGQREAARIRRHPNGRYQILSGERRYQALKLNKASHLRAIVVVCDDATALAEVALGNAARKDLDPIERAELLEQLIRPIAEGGSGLDRVTAGKYFGLESESGVKNAVRLLKLPESIRTLIRKGDLPERAARRLIPFCEAPTVIEAIAKDLEKTRKQAEKGDEYEWIETLTSLNDKRVPYWIREFVKDHTRPWNPKVIDFKGYGKQSVKRYFTPNDREAEELQVVELPSDDKEDSQRCLNVALWDRLNKELAEKAEAKEAAKSKKGTAKPSKGEKLTPAQVAAEAKRKQKEAEERLDKSTKEVRDRMLRASISIEAPIALVMTSLPWLVQKCSSDLSSVVPAVHHECSISSPFQVDKDRSETVARTLWARLLWPVSNSVKPRKGHSSMVSEELPDRLPGWIDDKELASLAKASGVSIESAWKMAATDGTDHRRLVAVWLARHTKEQLHNVIRELNINEGDSVCSRDELVGIVLKHHKPGKPLAIPKRLRGKL